jgi:phosphoserine phosphatase
MLSDATPLGETPLPLASGDEVILRLEQHRSKDAMLAFDADGTLWSGDVGIDTFETLLRERAVRAPAGLALREEARLADLPMQDDANEQAQQLYHGFQRGIYAEERAFPMMAWAFAGYGVEEMRAFANKVIRERKLAARIHPEVLPLLTWASHRGVPLYVVSASPVAVVSAAIELLNLPFTNVFAMSPAIANDQLLPRVTVPITYGAGKTAALKSGVSGATLLGAFGDSVFDLAMLREARVPVAVRPKPELRAGASTCPGLVELAPSSP